MTEKKEEITEKVENKAGEISLKDKKASLIKEYENINSLSEKNTLSVDDMPAWDGFRMFPERPSSDVEYTAMAGQPLTDTTTIATRADILPFLAEVKDPELDANILDLGMVYRFDIDKKGNVSIDLGLTSTGCPFMDVLPTTTAETVAMVKGVGTVVVKIVWEPPWDVSMMSENAKLNFNMF